MRDKIQKIRENALAEIDKAEGLEKLNDVRAAILGKKGELTAVLKGMKDVAPEDRPKVGQWVNETREAIEGLLEQKVKKFEAEALKRKYESEKIDVTMPAKKHEKGNLHFADLFIAEKISLECMTAFMCDHIDISACSVEVCKNKR